MLSPPCSQGHALRAMLPEPCSHGQAHGQAHERAHEPAHAHALSHGHALSLSGRRSLSRAGSLSLWQALSLVARSRQVCIYVVEALLIAIYLGNDLILIDIRKPSAERLSRPI